MRHVQSHEQEILFSSTPQEIAMPPQPARACQQFDIIGDVHGHASLLEALLAKLGYQQQGGAWQHPSREAIFVGDLIDKGPDPARALMLVSAMVENGSARMVVGNHELNWVNDAFLAQNDPQAFVAATRLHHDRMRLVEGFIDAGTGLAGLMEHFAWLRQQPLFIDEPELRVVHGSWDDEAIACLKAQQITCLDDHGMRHYREIYSKGYLAIDRVVAGCEHDFFDQPAPNGFRSRRQRVCWWPSREHKIHPVELAPVPARQGGYAQDQAPVFFGHYAMCGAPKLLGNNVAGVDYSATYGGELVAYRHTLGMALNPSQFVSIRTSMTEHADA
jgi:hypothetical protein